MADAYDLDIDGSEPMVHAPAHRVTELEAEVAWLRAALAHYADEASWVKGTGFSEHSAWYRWGGVRTSSVHREPWSVARAALEEAPRG